MDGFQEALYMVVGFSFKSIFANDPADKKNVCHFNSGLNPFSDQNISAAFLSQDFRFVESFNLNFSCCGARCVPSIPSKSWQNGGRKRFCGASLNLNNDQ